MMSTIPEILTADQQKAIAAEGSPLLLVAPAGSGKTEVLIRRLLRVLEDSRGEWFRVLAVTYTVRAGEELSSRVEASIADEFHRVEVSTIHGFALDWLRQHGKAIGIGPDVVVLSDDVDRYQILAGCIRSLGLQERLGADLGRSLGPILAAIDTHRTNHLRGDLSCCNEKKFFGLPLNEYYQAYESAMASAGLVDFPAMLTHLIALFNVDPWVLELFESIFGHVFVDEGQDLTRVQAELLRMITGKQVNLFVVADERQSINGFAGGSFENAKRLVGENPSRYLRLNHNFRCAGKVLQAAQRVAEKMLGDRLYVRTGHGAPPGQVQAVGLSSVQEEAAFVSDWVHGLLKAGLDKSILAEGEDSSVTAEQVAVVARKRYLLDPIVESLQFLGLDVVVQTDTSSSFDEPQARMALDGLALIANRRDQSAARRLTEVLEMLDITVDSDPLAAMAASGNDSIVHVADFVMAADESLESLDDSLSQVEQLGRDDGWPDGAARIAAAWRDYRATTRVQARSLAGFLQFLYRLQRTRPTDPGVRALTIHKVKGLEFRAVAITGAYDGNLPDYRAGTSEQVDEERRSFYVAMTRSARSLLVTWPRVTTDRFGGIHKRNPSRFVHEAGLI